MTLSLLDGHDVKSSPRAVAPMQQLNGFEREDAPQAAAMGDDFLVRRH
jgi:hypothetical protein